MIRKKKKRLNNNQIKNENIIANLKKENENYIKKKDENEKIFNIFIEEIKQASNTNNNDLKLFLNNLENKNHNLKELIVAKLGDNYLNKFNKYVNMDNVMTINFNSMEQKINFSLP